MIKFMKVRDILDNLNDNQMGYELRMSCMESEFTKENPKESDCGTLYSDCGDLNFEIDWNGKMSTYVKELCCYDEEACVVSWDGDDGNMINFKEVLVCDENKYVILI